MTIIKTKNINTIFGTETVSMWKIGKIYFIGKIGDNDNIVQHTSRDASYIYKMWQTV